VNVGEGVGVWGWVSGGCSKGCVGVGVWGKVGV